MRQDGARGVLLSVLKNGGASTLDIVANLRALLPQVAQVMPKEIVVKTLFDQSVFVKAAVVGVAMESADRRRPHRRDGAAVPRQLAQHAGDRADHPAVDPDLGHPPADPGRDRST